MLNLPASVRIFLCTQPADMRRSFDGLAQMVREFLAADPLSGHLFVFRSKRGDRIKLLYWDSDAWPSGTSVSKKARSVSRKRPRVTLSATSDANAVITT